MDYFKQLLSDMNCVIGKIQIVLIEASGYELGTRRFVLILNLSRLRIPIFPTDVDYLL